MVAVGTALPGALPGAQVEGGNLRIPRDSGKRSTKFVRNDKAGGERSRRVSRGNFLNSNGRGALRYLRPRAAGGTNGPTSVGLSDARSAPRGRGDGTARHPTVSEFGINPALELDNE